MAGKLALGFAIAPGVEHKQIEPIGRQPGNKGIVRGHVLGIAVEMDHRPQRLPLGGDEPARTSDFRAEADDTGDLSIRNILAPFANGARC